MIDYYIYYRVRADAQRADVLATVEALLARVNETTGIRGRLLQRVDDATTWMEIYPAVGDDQVAHFEEALAQAAGESALEQLLDPGTTRHTERFTPCA